jgi:hypothetical protein
VAFGPSLRWLEQHRPESSGAELGDLGMDAWSWCLFARLHPDAGVRRRATDQARDRLASLPRTIEPSVTALSWWALLLREMRAFNVDDAGRSAEIAALDLDAVLARAGPTTTLWTKLLLRRAGIDVSVSKAGTRVASLGETDSLSSRDAVAIYHEIAPAFDLGRAQPELFTAEELARVVELLPRLLLVCREADDVDAAAEVLIIAALLGDRERPYYREGIGWLVERQQADGSYHPGRDLSAARHGVLLGSWALLLVDAS